jgi:hypothetical protein
MIQYTSDVNPLATKDKLIAETVMWIPENINEPRPVTITRDIVFQSRYFHCYSDLHLAELVAIALDSCLDRMSADLGVTVVGNTQVDTLDGKTILMLPIALGTGDVSNRFDIIINQELASMYGFRTTPHPSISNAHIIRRTGNEQVLTVGYTPQKAYVAIPEMYQSSKQFPYKSIIFTSNSLSIEPLKRYNNADIDLNNASANVVTDLLLTVDDISNFYDTLVYQPQSYGRKIMMNSVNITNKLEITPLLESDDSLQSPIYIAPQGSCSILLQFRGTQPQ